MNDKKRADTLVKLTNDRWVRFVELQKVFVGDKMYNPVKQEFQVVSAVWPEKTPLSINDRREYVTYRVAICGFSCLQRDARVMKGEQA